MRGELRKPEDTESIRAGDKVYLPKGALQLFVNPDGSTGLTASAAIDPWLPDLSMAAATPPKVLDDISRRGFTVGSICGDQINVCRESDGLGEVLAQREVTRLKHLVVLDGESVIGVLDLDAARGRPPDSESASQRVRELCERLRKEDALDGKSPLVDYILNADERPFRVVKMPGGRPGTVDVDDLQKVPVRILLLMYFIQLEDALVRRLCEKEPDMLEQIRSDRGVDSALGKTGEGPIRRIEKLGFREVLQQAAIHRVLTISNQEQNMLVRFRNRLAHAPAWYVTRRGDVGWLVTCFKRVLELIDRVSFTDQEPGPHSGPEGVPR